MTTAVSSPTPLRYVIVVKEKVDREICYIDGKDGYDLLVQVDIIARPLIIKGICTLTEEAGVTITNNDNSPSEVTLTLLELRPVGYPAFVISSNLLRKIKVVTQ